MNLPRIGFGTSPYRANGARIDIEQPVRIALAAGYRMFDLAEMYGNERAVGRALRSGEAPPRRELSVIGKVWRTNFRPEHLRRACEASLQRIGIDTFDLYLLHAPDALQHIAPLDEASEIGSPEFERRAMSMTADDIPLQETWQAMRELVSAGLAANVGVSNFTPADIEKLGERPAANQIACWPMDAASLERHAQNGIDVLVYSPLRRDLLESPVIRGIAAKHARTPAQVLLRWLVQRGVRPLTSSVQEAHIRESLALDFALDAEDMSAMASLS